MKKIVIETKAGSREANANEYPIRLEPKSPAFDIEVNGVKCRARATSGKGKSAIPNYYFYFVEGDAMFYVRSTPDEIAALRAGEGKVKNAAIVVAAPDSEPVPAKEAEEAEEAPKARRKGRAKAEA